MYVHVVFPCIRYLKGGYAAYGEDLDAAQARLHAMLAGAAQQVSLQPSGVHSSFMR